MSDFMPDKGEWEDFKHSYGQAVNPSATRPVITIPEPTDIIIDLLRQINRKLPNAQ